MKSLDNVKIGSKYVTDFQKSAIKIAKNNFLFCLKAIKKLPILKVGPFARGRVGFLVKHGQILDFDVLMLITCLIV